MSESLLIRTLVVGVCDANCYVVGDRISKEAIIIDPGDNHEEIIEVARSEGLVIRGIINTHCHGDHILANSAIKNRFGCPILIHKLDAPGLEDPSINLSVMMGQSMVSPPADRLLEDGDEIEVGGTILRVIHTPGHSQGSICLLADDVLFSGDTLFAGGIGRCDFPGGDYEVLINSINDKLLVLPDDTPVYPGHGPATTIGRERTTNPWL